MLEARGVFRSLPAASFYHPFTAGQEQIRVVFPEVLREKEKKEMGLECWTGCEESEIKNMATRARGWKYTLQKCWPQVGSLIVENPELGPSTARMCLHMHTHTNTHTENDGAAEAGVDVLAISEEHVSTGMSALTGSS